jgi:hypothetical protein
MHTKITRTQFEDCLKLYFEQMQSGLFDRIKGTIGGAWQVIIDDMYRKEAERISPSSLAVIGECAELIVGVAKELKTNA